MPTYKLTATTPAGVFKRTTPQPYTHLVHYQPDGGRVPWTSWHTNQKAAERAARKWGKRSYGISAKVYPVDQPPG